MTLPSKTDLSTLDIAYLGAPFVQVEAKTLNTNTLDIAYLGAPFVAATIGSSGLNIFVKVGGVWKQASEMYVNVSGVWKSVTAINTKVGGVWKG